MSGKIFGGYLGVGRRFTIQNCDDHSFGECPYSDLELTAGGTLFGESLIGVPLYLSAGVGVNLGPGGGALLDAELGVRFGSHPNLGVVFGVRTTRIWNRYDALALIVGLRFPVLRL